MPTKTNRATWRARGRRLSRVHVGLQWAVGDWLDEGGRLGCTMKEAADIVGMPVQTLANCQYVAGRYPKADRTFKLPWSHYAEVASKPNRLALLATAQTCGWSRDELRTRARTGRPAIRARIKRVSVWLPEDTYQQLRTMSEPGNLVSVLVADMIVESLR